MKQIKCKTARLADVNNTVNPAEQVYDRARYEYRAAINDYARVSIIEEDAAEIMTRAYLLGRILGKTPAKIKNDMEDGINE